MLAALTKGQTLVNVLGIENSTTTTYCISNFNQFVGLSRASREAGPTLCHGVMPCKRLWSPLLVPVLAEFGVERSASTMVMSSSHS
jgi:hypothetical protein